jgi:hypothetical protein
LHSLVLVAGSGGLFLVELERVGDTVFDTVF